MKFLKTGNKTVKSFGQAGAWLESSIKTFCLRNCESSLKDEAKWLLSQIEGEYFARLKSVSGEQLEVDHVIVVDASKEIVWNCVEDRGLKMDFSIFNDCVGDDAKYCVVLELKRLAKQPSAKRGRKSRKTDPEKRKANRIAAR